MLHHRLRAAAGRQGVGGFSPADLFLSGEVGFWLSAYDAATLFQNTAGTVAVVSDGEPVARWNDKSPNNYDFTNGGGTDRPLFKSLAGVNWLQFDGSNDFFSRAATDLFRSVRYALVAVCLRSSGGGAVKRIVHVSISTNSGTNRMSLRTQSGPDAAYYAGRRLDADSEQVVSLGEAKFGDASVYISHTRFNDAELDVYKNGVKSIDSEPFQTSGATSDATSALALLGCTQNATGTRSQFMDMELHEIVVVGRSSSPFTESEILGLNSYMQGLL